MPGFSEQPKRTLTADTKSDDVSIVERMERLRRLAKKSKAEALKPDNVAELLREITGLSETYHAESGLRPQFFEIEGKGDFTCFPKLTSNGESFVAAIKYGKDSGRLIIGKHSDHPIDSRLEISAINSTIGTLFPVILRNEHLQLFNETGQKVFDAKDLGYPNEAKNFVIFPEGIHYFSTEKGYLFYSFHDKQSRPCNIKIEPKLLGENITWTEEYQATRKQPKFETMHLNGEKVGKEYHEVLGSFVHKDKVFFVVSKINFLSYQVLIVDDTGKETVIHEDSRMFKSGEHETKVDIHEYGFELHDSRKIDKNKISKDYFDAVFDFDGKIMFEYNNAYGYYYLGSIDGRDMFCLHTGVKPGENRIVCSDGSVIADLDKHPLRDGMTFFESDMYYLTTDDKGLFREIVSVKGQKINKKFDGLAKLQVVADKLFIRGSNPGKMGFIVYDENGEAVLEGASVIRLFEVNNQPTFLVPDDNIAVKKWHLKDEQGNVLLSDIPFEPREIKKVEDRLLAFIYGDGPGQYDDVFDSATGETHSYMKVTWQAVGNVAFMAKMKNGKWSLHDYDFNPIGSEYDEFSDARERNGKLWVLGKRDGMVVYEPVGGVN